MTRIADKILVNKWSNVPKMSINRSPGTMEVPSPFNRHQPEVNPVATLSHMRFKFTLREVKYSGDPNTKCVRSKIGKIPNCSVFQSETGHKNVWFSSVRHCSYPIFMSLWSLPNASAINVATDEMCTLHLLRKKQAMINNNNCKVL